MAEIFSTSPEHFEGKDAIGHVAAAHAKGMMYKVEGHAHEISGYFSAAADAAKDTALLLGLLWVLFQHEGLPVTLSLQSIILLGGGWLLWRFGRSAWLGWSRLERLHRVLREEKWEIEHHRKQEREELRVLYSAKGFEGKLLEDVLDVLMADGDRLLRVMVEEELGLSLEQQEHPLQQALGAAVGSFIAICVVVVAIWCAGLLGAIFSSIAVAAITSVLIAHYEQNRLIPAAVWTIGLVLVPLSFVYFLTAYFG